MSHYFILPFDHDKSISKFETEYENLLKKLGVSHLPHSYIPSTLEDKALIKDYEDHILPAFRIEYDAAISPILESASTGPEIPFDVTVIQTGGTQYNKDQFLSIVIEVDNPHLAVEMKLQGIEQIVEDFYFQSYGRSFLPHQK